MIKLSRRLEKIATFVDDGANIVDIGCDHALLDIYLVLNRKNIKVVASDVNKNALNNALNNIKKYKLTDKIDTVLSNGLESIDVTGLDTIIISGMGTHTMVGILYNNLSKLKNINTIILQSNNDVDFLRKKVTSIGYYIEQEALVKDKKIIYTIIKFKKGHKFYSYKELYFGPCLLKENSSLFKEKNKLELEKLKIIYPMIPKGHLMYKLKTLRKIKMYTNIIKEK